MRLLIVGGGGREHALAWKCAASEAVTALFVAPGNGGVARLARTDPRVACLPVKDGDLDGLCAAIARHAIDLVIVGPELPLTLGLADRCAELGVPCFGPRQAAARLEGSKVFAKQAMVAAGVPTAAFEIFQDVDLARSHVAQRPLPMVIKADGLAAGKGVVVARTREEALDAVEAMLSRRVFGAAGATILVEDCLAGEEVSLLALCDGERVLALPTCQDHKAVGDGDTGPNTGGMGAYSPAPALPDHRLQAACEAAILPMVRHLAAQGSPFVGVLYAGLMLVDEVPFVLEYNVRFGDPECQPIMVRLEGDLPGLLLSCCQGRLDPSLLAIRPEPACCVVLASQGYPGDYATGFSIAGLDEAEAVEGVTVFHAGTRAGTRADAQEEDGTILTAGGRVLGVTALGSDLLQARDRAYQAAERIAFEGKFLRTDIARKGLRRLGLE